MTNFNFSNVQFEILDITTNATPDIFINQTGITFTKKVLDVLNYPANVQYLISAEQNVFAIRSCKANDVKAVPFSKPKAEQTATLTSKNKTIIEVLKKLINEYDGSKRYKVEGQYDNNSKTIYFEMNKATITD